MYILYRLLLTIVHIVYSCIETFMILWCFVRKKYETLWHKSEIQDDIYLISSCIKQIKNIPSHLAFILVNEDVIALEDLANLVLWSLAAGVSFLSFYDQEGKLKQLEEKLIAEVARKKGSLDNIAWGPSPKTTNGKAACNGSSNGLKNGCKVQRTLRVVVLSHREGRGMLAEAAKLMASHGLSPEPGAGLSVEQMNKYINMAFQEDGWQARARGEVVPEPELAVWCGSLTCNTGFLPWHIRVTEFLQLPSHRGVTSQDFVQLLQRYNRCEQRLGK